ncbi:MAG: peptidase M16 [Pelagibacteraceae bacterium]|nr:peptidase M16 [Pelagibacteraceae bacterium]|tara:strand:+ start:8433 stop:9689 length:1257 start_codon:yes stop_codon:yes gene_type:complete
MTKISTLDNGLRVVTQNMPGLETIAMGVWNNVGGRDEQENVNGVAHFLEHMAFKGTKTKTSKQIAEAIENVGGDINAYTSTETTAYHVRLIAEDLQVGVDILTDILQNSIFSKEELEVERGVILQEIGRTMDSPDSKLFDKFQETAFPDQPIGRSLLGPKNIIKNISRDEIKNFMTSNYNPKKMIVSAAGKINHEEFVDRIIKSCTNLPKGTVENRFKSNYKGGEYREEKDLEQIHLIASFEGTDFYHEDYYSLLVYNSILGEGMSSKLFQEIREKRGLVYTISSFMFPFTDTGLFGVYCGTGENQIKELLPVLCDQLNDSPNSISLEEINKGKAQLKAGLLMSRERAANRCRKAAYQLLYHNRIIESDEIIKKIDNVTKETIQRIAKKTLSTNMTVSSIGPIGKLETIEKIQSRLNY